MSKVYNYLTRVYYDDTDASGLVYHANYLKMAERARTTLLHEQGIFHNHLINKFDVGFVVRSADMSFNKPALLDDLLTVKTSVLEMKKASVVLSQEICRDEEILVGIQLKLAMINKKGKPVRFPEEILKALN